MIDKEPGRETWIDNRWRPAMGWMYFVVCITDFILFPILQPLFQSMVGITVTPWRPLTLENGGLFHLAMGAIVGVTAWSRGKEKLHGISGDTKEIPPINDRVGSDTNIDFRKQRIEPRLSKPQQPNYPEL